MPTRVRNYVWANLTSSDCKHTHTYKVLPDAKLCAGKLAPSRMQNTHPHSMYSPMGRRNCVQTKLKSSDYLAHPHNMHLGCEIACGWRSRRAIAKHTHITCTSTKGAKLRADKAHIERMQTHTTQSMHFQRSNEFVCGPSSHQASPGNTHITCTSR